MIHATVVCENVTERDNLVKELKKLPGVTVNDCILAVAIDFDAPDYCTDLEIERITTRLIDLVESVNIHGVVIS